MGRGKKKIRVFPDYGSLLMIRLPDGRLNIGQYLDRYGNDEGFMPVVNDEFTYTDAEPGSFEKICVLAERVMLGLPLFHPLDAQKKYTREPRNGF